MDPSLSDETAIKLLLVDDEPILLDIGKAFIERSGNFRVEPKLSAKDALKWLTTSEDCEIIVSDYDMPHMDGIDFLKEVKANYPDIPFIIFTGKGKEEVAMEALNSGATFYLQKGGDPKLQFLELVSKIKHAINEKRAEKQAVENQRKLHVLVQSLPGMAYRCKNDKNLTMEYLSDRCFELTGYSQEDFIGNKNISYSNIIVPDDREKVNLEIKKSIRLKKPFELNYRILTSKGEIKHVWEQGLGIHNSKGKLVAFEGYITDVTNRVRTEAALKESERKFTTLIENLPGIVFRCKNDTNWTMEYISRGCLKLTGYSQEDFIDNKNISYAQIIHPDDSEGIWNEIELAIQQKKHYKIVYRIITADDEIKWVWEQGCGVWTEKELVMIEGFIADITKQKLYQTKLLESERKLTTLIENLPGMAFKCKNEPEWTMKYASEGSKDLTGYDPLDLIDSTKISFGNIIHPEDRQVVWDEIQSSLDLKKKFKIVYRIITAKGKTKQVCCQGSGVYKDGKVVTLEGFMTDVTEHKSWDKE